jgi:hypothetical protein
MVGAPGKTRTCDLELRSLLLYPAELRGQSNQAYYLLTGDTIAQIYFCSVDVMTAMNSDAPGVICGFLAGLMARK